MQQRNCHTPLSRPTSACYFLIIAYSSTAFSLFAAALPDILAYRVPQVSWTGRWVEIPAVVVLSICCLVNFIIFWFRGYLAAPQNAIGVHSTFLGLCIWVLVLSSSAGPSRLWKSSIAGGEGNNPSDYLDCNTLARNGPDCSVKELRTISALQISAITFLSLTLLSEGVLLILSYQACSDQLMDKWRRRRVALRSSRSGTKHPQITASYEPDIHFVNEIPGSEKNYA